MTEPDVSKNDEDGPVVRVWERVLGTATGLKRTWVLVSLFALLVAFATYTVLRIHVTYAMQSEIALLKSIHASDIESAETFKRDCSHRLDVLEQTLFGEVLPKQQQLTKPGAETLRQSRYELSQNTTNKEMRGRLERLERRLWELSREGR